MKKRLLGLDILRDIGVIFIFFYHFFIEYVVSGQGTDVSMLDYNYFFNILARPASIFLFLISGYALMYNHEEDMPLSKYYLRRFKGLFIPFYIAYIFTFIACYIVNGQMPGAGVAKRFFIFTLTGTDGVAQMVYPTFYLIGEWFMSCIVVCYVLFPLLAWLHKRFRILTLILLIVWYLILLLVHNPFPFTQLMNPLLILVYFYVGMDLQTSFGDREFKKYARIIAGIISILVFVYFCIIGYVPSLAFLILPQEQTELIYFAWSIALFIALRDIDLKEGKPLYKFVTYLSGISWFIILMHHRIMILFYSHIDVSTFSRSQIWLLLLACIVITLLASELVRMVSNKAKILIFGK